MCLSWVFVSSPNSCLLCWIPVIICQRLCVSLQMDRFLRRIPCLGVVPMSAIQSFCCAGWEKLRLHSTLLETSGRGGFKWVRLRRCAQTYFGTKKMCTNPNPEPKSQSGSWVRKGLRTQAARSIQDYNLVTTI